MEEQRATEQIRLAAFHLSSISLPNDLRLSSSNFISSLCWKEFKTVKFPRKAFPTVSYQENSYSNPGSVRTPQHIVCSSIWRDSNCCNSKPCQTAWSHEMIVPRSIRLIKDLLIWSRREFVYTTFELFGWRLHSGMRLFGDILGWKTRDFPNAVSNAASHCSVRLDSSSSRQLHCFIKQPRCS